MKKVFLHFFFLYFFWQIFITLFDISTRHIDPFSNKDYKVNSYKSRDPVYLVSYADGDEVFYQNQHALVQSGINRGIDFFLSYRKSLLDEDFYNKNKSVLDEKSGAGYWLWKPYIILKTLENSPDNSVIIYADSGMIFTSSLVPLIEKTKNFDALLFACDENTYRNLDNATDKKVSEETGADKLNNFKNHPQVWGCFMIFKNTIKTREFVKKWLEMCLKTSWLKGYGVSSHYHDQSLMAICFLKNPDGILLMHEKDFWPIAKWHHRHKNEENYSLLVYQQPGMHYFEHKAWRFPPLKWFRYVFYKGWY